MKRSVATIVGLLALALSASFAQAEVKTDADAKVTYEVPAGFTATTKDNLTALNDQKNEMAFFLVRTNEKDLDKAMAELDKLVAPYIKDIKIAGKPSTATYNGMKAFQVKGTGTFESKPVNVTLRILETPNKAFFVVAGVYLTSKKEELKDTFNKFYNSIKPAS
jgi:hypothetical protein